MKRNKFQQMLMRSLDKVQRKKKKQHKTKTKPKEKNPMEFPPDNLGDLKAIAASICV